MIILLNKIYEAGIELPMTKRNILKIIASIYDPIDIISPVVALFKILFQNLFSVIGLLAEFQMSGI